MGSSADRSGASLALVIAVVGALGVVAGIRRATPGMPRSTLNGETALVAQPAL